MKNKKIIASVGSLALMLNLVLPGIAFGQATQTGDITIDCTGAVTDVAMMDTPNNVTFEGKSVSVGGDVKSSVSAISHADATAGYLNYSTNLEVVGQTVEDCEGTMTDWSVKVASTDLTSSLTTTDIIPASSLYVKKSYLVANAGNTAALECTDGSANGACINIDAVGPQQTDFLSVLNLTASCLDNTPTNWDDDTAPLDLSNSFQVTNCPLNTAQPLLTFNHDTIATDQGFNATANIGVTLAIVEGIAADQAPGTYTGTITYTFAPSL